MTVKDIKNMAYYEECCDNLDIPEMLLYLEAEAIYKMFKNGFYDLDTAKKKIAKAENDYKSFRILSDCFDEALAQQNKLEWLKAEYNKTKSAEAAIKIAEAITNPHTVVEIEEE